MSAQLLKQHQGTKLDRSRCQRARFADYFAAGQASDNVDDWLTLKGIGPWTVNYVKLRSSKDPDIWLAGDAGINNALKCFDGDFDIEKIKPWRSCLTMQLWNQLN